MEQQKREHKGEKNSNNENNKIEMWRRRKNTQRIEIVFFVLVYASIYYIYSIDEIHLFSYNYICCCFFLSELNIVLFWNNSVMFIFLFFYFKIDKNRKLDDRKGEKERRKNRKASRCATEKKKRCISIG